MDGEKSVLLGPERSLEMYVRLREEGMTQNQARKEAGVTVRQARKMDQVVAFHRKMARAR